MHILAFLRTPTLLFSALLTSLDLSHNGIGCPESSGIIALAGALVISPLTSLNLKRNQIDAAAKTLVRDACASKKGMRLELEDISYGTEAFI